MTNLLKYKLNILNWFVSVPRMHGVVLLITIVALAVAIYWNGNLFDRLGLCNFKETKIVFSNQGKASYKDNKLILSIVTKPVLAARFYKDTGDGLTWYKDITQSIKTVGDEQITLRPLSLNEDKVVVCISETKKDSFKNLTDGEKVDKYLPSPFISKDDDWINIKNQDGNNNVDYLGDNFSFKYPKNLFLYTDNGNIWLFTKKESQKNIEKYSHGMDLPSAYVKISVYSNPQNFSPKQFYLYHLYGKGPKYVNGDLDIDVNDYSKFNVYSQENMPENLNNYGSYFVANSIFTKLKDKMLVVEGLQLNKLFASVISSLIVSN